MPRKYYKSMSDAKALEVKVSFRCPNTKDKVIIFPEEYSWSGYSDRMGTFISFDITECASCRRYHTIYVKEG